MRDTPLFSFQSFFVTTKGWLDKYDRSNNDHNGPSDDWAAKYFNLSIK